MSDFFACMRQKYSLALCGECRNSMVRTEFATPARFQSRSRPILNCRLPKSRDFFTLKQKKNIYFLALWVGMPLFDGWDTEFVTPVRFCLRSRAHSSGAVFSYTCEKNISWHCGWECPNSLVGTPNLRH